MNVADSREQQVKQFVAIAERLIQKLKDEKYGDWINGLNELAGPLDRARVGVGPDRDDFPAVGILPVGDDDAAETLSRADEVRAKNPTAARWLSAIASCEDWFRSRPCPELSTGLVVLWRDPFDTGGRHIHELDPKDGAATELAEDIIRTLNRWICYVEGKPPGAEVARFSDSTELSAARGFADEILDRARMRGEFAELAADDVPEDTSNNTKVPCAPRECRGKSGSGVSRVDVQAYLEKCRLRGERFTSQEDFAERIGCVKSTVSVAINEGSVELQEWAKKQRGSSRCNTTPEVAAVVFENTPQAREPDPADNLEDGDVDAAMAYLLEQAGPDERKQIGAMSPDQRRKLAETVFRDPDEQEQVDRHRRRKGSTRR